MMNMTTILDISTDPRVKEGYPLLKRFAHEAHKDTFYGNKPYMYHLDSVASVFWQWFGVPTWEELCTIYLHDVEEDTEYKANDFFDSLRGREHLRECGWPVIYSVRVLTNRSKVYEHYIRSLVNDLQTSWEIGFIVAVKVKIADNISNLQHSTKEGD